MNLTPEIVKDLWHYMCGRYGTTVIRKQDSWLMRAAARVLPTPGFLDSYVTTIGKTIYVPFEIGNDGVIGGHVWSLESQVAVCAHEHQHVCQQRRDGLAYPWRYVTSTAARAAYETEAYTTTLEVKAALGSDGEELYEEASRHAFGLRNYGCSEKDVEVSGIALRNAVYEIRTGGNVKTEAARVALIHLGLIKITTILMSCSE